MDENANAFAAETNQTAEVGKRYLRENDNNLERALDAYRREMASFAKPSMTTSSSSSSSSTSTRRVATLGSLARDAGEDADGSNANNSYYAGGKQSGISVLGGDDGEDRANDPASMMRRFMQQLQQRGVGMDQYKREESEAKKGKTSFVGVGHTLGETEDDSTTVGSPEVMPGKGGLEPKKLLLEIWKDGYSVDDGDSQGELQPLAPNSTFLATLAMGRVPRELAEEYGTSIDLEVMDRRGENYVKRKRPAKAFAGSGHRLGNVVPSTTSSSSTVSTPATTMSPPATTSSSTSSSTAPTAVPVNAVDPSKPTTKIQIRLANGSRLVAHFNTTDTIADLYAFVNQANPESAHRAYFLLSSYPRKQLEIGATATLEEANLLNTAIFQKWA